MELSSTGVAVNRAYTSPTSYLICDFGGAGQEEDKTENWTGEAAALISIRNKGIEH
jgi:hypothetical protein